MEQRRRWERPVFPEDACEHLSVDIFQGALLKVALGGIDPEAYDPQRHGGPELQGLALPDVCLGQGCQLHPPRHSLVEPGHPEGLDRHPDLQ